MRVVSVHGVGGCRLPQQHGSARQLQARGRNNAFGLCRAQRHANHSWEAVLHSLLLYLCYALNPKPYTCLAFAFL